MKKNIFWDFDGVILDSLPIKDFGFIKIFENYPKKLVKEFENFDMNKIYAKSIYFLNEVFLP